MTSVLLLYMVVKMELPLTEIGKAIRVAGSLGEERAWYRDHHHQVKIKKHLDI